MVSESEEEEVEEEVKGTEMFIKGERIVRRGSRWSRLAWNFERISSV